MKSPFAIFRKHQRALMVVLTGLAMFAFVVMDNLRNDRPDQFLPILCGMLGAGVFALIGWRSGEAVKYGIIGTILGVLIGLFIPGKAGPLPAVETDIGNLSHADMQNLIGRRQNANNFVRFAFEKILPRIENNQFMAEFIEQQLRSRMFTFGNEDIAADVILGHLLEKEADEMGIVVSDSTVSDFINRMTNRRLTPSQFAAVLKTLHLSEAQVFDAIRGELRARLAMEMLVPRAIQTPEQYWEDYRKLQVRETLDVAGVPVADFVASAPEPTADQLQAYFDQWKSIAPMAPGAQGLRQPRRVRVEYLQADYADTEKEVAAKPITDEEVKKYYDEHHEEYRNRPAEPLPGQSGGHASPGMSVPPGMSIPPGPAMPPPASSTPPAPGETTAKDAAVPPPPVGSSPETKASKEGAAPATSPGQGPAPGKASEKSNDAKSPGKSGTSLERAIRGVVRHVSDQPERAATADVRLAAYQPAAAKDEGPKSGAAKKSDPANAAPKKTEPKTGSGKASANSSAADKAPATVPGTAAPGGAASSEPAAPPLPEKSAAPGSPARSPGARQPVTATRPEPEFRPLDEILQREIRDSILRSRTQQAMKAKIQAGYEFMSKMREELISSTLNEPPKMSPERREKALAEYAAKHGLKHVYAPLMSGQELHDASAEYPIAAAAEPVDDPFQQRAPIEVIRQLFMSPPEQVFIPMQAEDRDSRWFAFWKTEDVADHVPTLEEPGMRARAVLAWKTSEFAQKKAQERAEQLADLVRKSKSPIAETLAGQTVTAKEKGPAVVIVPTAPFSWLSVPSAAPRDMSPDTQPRLSTISGVKDADDQFMKVVFNEMKVGDVRVVPNQGRTILYVVKILTRHPADKEEMEGFRARFAKENLFGGGNFGGGRTTYDYLAMPEQIQVNNEWARRLYTKYNVRRNDTEERRPRRRMAG